MESGSRDIQFASAGQTPLQLEGRLHLPPGDEPFVAAVVAHPHPLWGGSMHNAVVLQIARTLAARGCAALRFNFRGTGGSQGRHDEGRGEIDDVVGALNCLAARPEVDAGRLAVVGYSFGAWVGGRVAVRHAPVCAYAAVALPMRDPFGVDLGHFARPKCFITGARDTLSPPGMLRQYVDALPKPKTLHVIPGADHTLSGHEQMAADYVADFVLSALC